MTTITTRRPATGAELQAEIDRLTAAHCEQYDEIHRLRGALRTGASLLEQGCNPKDMAASMRRVLLPNASLSGGRRTQTMNIEAAGRGLSECSALLGKYGDVLAPFVELMEAELHANAGKGDRPGWLTMSPAVGMLEIYYHAAKLQKAVKDRDMPKIREHSADVANMAMMLLDVCGGLLPNAEAVRKTGPAGDQL